MLALQIAIALAMMGGDLLRVLPELVSGRPSAPSLEEPVRPGDQTRRYAPRRVLPDTRPAQDLPGVGDMPRRLTWSVGETWGRSTLRLVGDIQPGDAARLGAHLDGLAEMPELVSLHSPGGSVSDALEIGRRLREDGIGTVVGSRSVCFSACPYILAGGVERIVSREGLVGVHQHYFGENMVLPAFIAVADIQHGQAEVMTFLDEMGVDPLLTAVAMRTPPEDIYVLLEEELERFSLATELVD